MMTKKPTLKATVLNIDDVYVQIKLQGDSLSFKKELFSELPKIGDEIFITLQKHEDFKKNNEHLSKTILNRIFSKTP